MTAQHFNPNDTLKEDPVSENGTLPAKDTTDTLTTWVQMRTHAGPPTIGSRLEIFPRVRREIEGLGGFGALCDRPVRGTIIDVGAHWSDQPMGRAGWWVQVELDEVPTQNGRPVTQEELA